MLCLRNVVLTSTKSFGTSDARGKDCDYPQPPPGIWGDIFYAGRVLIDTVDTEEFCGIQNVLASICARESTDLAMPGGI